MKPIDRMGMASLYPTMPEFTREDRRPIRRLVVNFETVEDQRKHKAKLEAGK